MSDATKYGYTNIRTGERIDPDSIIKEDERGLIIKFNEDDYKYKFIPANEFEKNVLSSTLGYSDPDTPSLQIKRETDEYDNIDDSVIPKYLGTKYTYKFGLDNMEIVQSRPNNVSAFLTSPINIGKCSYIELFVDQDLTLASTEYYIVEGTLDTPILPSNMNRVYNERLFFNKDTRFEIDATMPVVIYKNGERTTMTSNDLLDADFGNNVFTIEYTPIINSYRYFPETENVQIKIIQRCDNNLLPSSINSVVIIKHGGGKIWSI